MFNAFMHLDWFAIAAAVAAYFVLGGIWFRTVVGRAYVVALGVEQKSGALSLIGPLLCLTVVTITSAMLIQSFAVTTYVSGAIFGTVVGVGYLTPMVFNIANNPLFPRPLLYSLINAPFFIAGSIFSSVIIVGMGR